MQYSKPNPDSPIEILIWTSRSYISSLLNGIPTRRQLSEEVDRFGGEALLSPLSHFWDVVMAATNEKLIMHEPTCPCVSMHEQSLVMALRCLQKSDRVAAAASLASILPLGAVRSLLPTLQELADTMNRMECEFDPDIATIRPPRARPQLRIVH